MRQRCGVPEGTDILDAVNAREPAQRAQALAIIEEMEDAALADMALMPGAMQLCAALDGMAIPRGLITRNVKRSVDYFHARHFSSHAASSSSSSLRSIGCTISATSSGVGSSSLTTAALLAAKPFLPAISRECGFAYKPSPEALLHICGQWGISPAECAMVGDSPKDDVRSGNRAGAVTILLDYQASAGLLAEHFEGDCRPHHVVTSLEAVLQVLQDHYQLAPPLPSS